MADVASLRREWPAWAPWLASVEETLHEAGSREWDDMVPEPAAGRSPSEPMIAGAVLLVDAALVRRLSEHLGVATADPLDLLAASLSHERPGLAGLLPVPLLRACERRWGAGAAREWTESYCPICGAWPVFQEECGTDHGRWSRCGRCGGRWHAQRLRCVFCGTRDHERLVSLVPRDGTPRGGVEACARCGGYVKTLNALRPCAAGEVMLHDLDSVELDAAALGRGYRRPPGLGCALNVSVAAR